MFWSLQRGEPELWAKPPGFWLITQRQVQKEHWSCTGGSQSLYPVVFHQRPFWHSKSWLEIASDAMFSAFDLSLRNTGWPGALGVTERFHILCSIYTLYVFMCVHTHTYNTSRQPISFAYSLYDVWFILLHELTRYIWLRSIKSDFSIFINWFFKRELCYFRT